MKDSINFNSTTPIIFNNEVVGGILIDIKALQADGTTVCDIADLDKVPLSIEVFRGGSKQGITILNDYLGFILRTYTAGSTRYTIATTKRPEGYFIEIPFDGAISLTGEDKIVIKSKAVNTAFTSLSTANSDITFETIPSPLAFSNVITVFDTVNYGAGTDNIDESIGSGIAKIVLLHDSGADYLASTEAKPVDGITLTANNFDKDASENLLINENLNMHSLNPETPIKDLVIYDSVNVLTNAKFKAKYNKSVLATAKIGLLRRIYI